MDVSRPAVVVVDEPANEREQQRRQPAASGSAPVVRLPLAPPSDAVDRKLAVLRAGSGPFEPVYSYVFDVPGKRIRSRMTLAAASLLGDEWQVDDRSISAATGVELIHEASLIHDDIADGSPLRRGRPSVPARFGIRFAALAGVHVAADAVGLLAAAMRPDATGWAPDGARAVVGISDLSAGQLAELRSVTPAPDELANHYRRVAQFKTGTLFRFALSIGWTLLDGAASGARALHEYATQLGFAFQVMDDVRDITGSTDLGKDLGTDAANGIPTWPVVRWLGSDPASTARWLDVRSDPSARRVAEFCAAVASSDAIGLARADAESAAAAAVDALAGFPDSPGRNYLANLARQVVA